MCGVIGVISKNRKVNIHELDSMLKSISHRGPDGEGVYINSNGLIGLGHRRLAIIDLHQSADQPFLLENEGISIVFNGEIYNHANLRNELIAEGHTFVTSHSDTEVLALGFKAWGIDKLIEKLNGMFAFIVHSEVDGKVYVARDRFGIKPLYIYRADHSTYVSSELKAFYQIGGFRAVLNESHLADHLYFRSLPSPYTLIKNVEKIASGSYITFDLSTNAETETHYWPSKPQKSAEYKESIEDLLESSVELMAKADVPVGVFLSGGIDSGLIAGISSKHLEDITAFTVSYSGQDRYNEFDKAEMVAKSINASHVKVEISEAEFLRDLSKMTYFLEEPISAPVCVPVMRLAEEARKYAIPVALAGEGADEVFIGYKSWIRILRLSSVLKFIPNVMISKTAGFVALFLSKFGGRRTARTRDLLIRLRDNLPLFWGGAWDFTTYDLTRLLKRKITIKSIYKKNISPIHEDFINQYSRLDFSAWMMFCDARFRLPELMLPRLDKLCMASSVEGRVPFLDHRLFDNFISDSESTRNGNIKLGKDIVRKVYAKYFCHLNSKAKKIGFKAPVSEWKSGAAGKFSLRIVAIFLERTDIFDKEYMMKIMHSKNDRLYYSLLNFVIWYNQFIDEVLPEFDLKYDDR